MHPSVHSLRTAVVSREQGPGAGLWPSVPQLLLSQQLHLISSQDWGSRLNNLGEDMKHASTKAVAEPGSD